MGNSTKKLIELGAKVVGVDNDPSKVDSSVNIPIVICDFLNFPFQSRIADMVVFCFTLHEINPNFHFRALSIARKIAPQVIIVEPTPNGCPAYEEFAWIWRNAMRSIGKFEEYKTPEYWENILKKAGFRITLKKIVSWHATIPPEVLNDIVKTTIKEWRRKRVAERWIKALQTKFLEESLKMKWSDILVIVGRI
ncbi:class I SAM-dependent methyltransferase [Thermococcus sp.]